MYRFYLPSNFLHLVGHVAHDAIYLGDGDLDPLAEWREHLREDDLFIPDRIVAVPLHGGAALTENSNTLK